MRHKSDPVELIRNSNPVPDAHQLPDATATSFEALFEEIIGMKDQATKPTGTRQQRSRPKRRTTRRVVLLAAAFLVATASMAGAAMTLLQPDPEQAAVVDEVFDPMRGEIHPLDWRPDLQAEQTKCLLPGADEFVQERLASIASNFPLEERLTVEHLATACTDGNAYASENGYTAAGAEVCVDDGGRYVDPTVVIDGTDCALASPDLRPITEQDLADLNEMRAIEVALLAVPSENGCPTFDDARQWVTSQVDQLALSLNIVEGDQGSDVCYRGTVTWSLDQVNIESVGPAPADS